MNKKLVDKDNNEAKKTNVLCLFVIIGVIVAFAKAKIVQMSQITLDFSCENIKYSQLE